MRSTANARDQVVTQEKYLADIQTQHDDAFQRVVDGSVISSAKSVEPGIEELSEDGELRMTLILRQGNGPRLTMQQSLL